MPFLCLPLVMAASLASPVQDVPSDSVMSGLKPFVGKWTGDFVMGPARMKMDLDCRLFGGHWCELTYAYSSPQMKLDYRVLVGPSEDGKSFRAWSFGVDGKVPDEFKGVMDEEALAFTRTTGDPFVIRFSIGRDKTLQMKLATAGDKPKDLGGASLKRVPEPASAGLQAGRQGGMAGA